MVRSGVDGSAAGATTAVPAANCEPSPDGGDVAGFREADVHLRPRTFGVIEFFLSRSRYVGGDVRLINASRYMEILIFFLLFASFSN